MAAALEALDGAIDGASAAGISAKYAKKMRRRLQVQLDVATGRAPEPRAKPGAAGAGAARADAELAPERPQTPPHVAGQPARASPGPAPAAPQPDSGLGSGLRLAGAAMPARPLVQAYTPAGGPPQAYTPAGGPPQPRPQPSPRAPPAAWAGAAAGRQAAGPVEHPNAGPKPCAAAPSIAQTPRAWEAPPQQAPAPVSAPLAAPLVVPVAVPASAWSPGQGRRADQCGPWRSPAGGHPARTTPHAPSSPWPAPVLASAPHPPRRTSPLEPYRDTVMCLKPCATDPKPSSGPVVPPLANGGPAPAWGAPALGRPAEAPGAMLPPRSRPMLGSDPGGGGGSLFVGLQGAPALVSGAMQGPGEWLGSLGHALVPGSPLRADGRPGALAGADGGGGTPHRGSGELRREVGLDIGLGFEARPLGPAAYGSFGGDGFTAASRRSGDGASLFSNPIPSRSNPVQNPVPASAAPFPLMGGGFNGAPGPLDGGSSTHAVAGLGELGVGLQPGGVAARSLQLGQDHFGSMASHGSLASSGAMHMLAASLSENTDFCAFAFMETPRHAHQIQVR